MRISIYIRVSTEDQAKEGHSLEVQREYLESFADREGYEIFKVYQDDGISGYSTERHALKELLKDAKEGRFDLVLVYKIDRFSRNLKDLLTLVDELSSYGIGFKSATEIFDSTTSAGKLMFQQLGSFAEFERNRLAERVFPGMVKGVQQGNWQGARFSPYGYSYVKGKKVLEIDEQEAQVVRLIYSMCLSDRSIRSITEYLTKKKYRNRMGNIFSTKLIGDILKNRVYTGKLVWNKNHYDRSQKTQKGYRYIKNPPDKLIIAQGKHHPIISDADFELAQEKLKERRVERTHRASDYPLSGLLYCAKCNHRYLGVSSISNHRTGFKKRWYRCSGPQKSFIRCKNNAVKADVIEPEAAGILEKLLKNDKLKNSRWYEPSGTYRWMNMTPADFPAFEEISKAELEKLQNRLKINHQKQSKLTDAYLENLLSEDVFKSKNEGLRTEDEELKKLIALEEVRDIERERSKDYLNRANDFLDCYNPKKKILDPLTKKQILQLLFKNIKVAPIRGSRPHGAGANRIKSYEFFAPFSVLYRSACGGNFSGNNRENQKTKCLKNQSLSRIRVQKSSLRLTDVK